MNSSTSPKEDESFQISEGSASGLTPADNTTLEYGRQEYLKSMDSAKDYAKSMVTLVSGFFLAYFALLKFLGAEPISNLDEAIMRSLCVIPPIIFAICIAAFVLAILPLRASLILNDLWSIERSRVNTLRTRHFVSYGATGLFLLGIALTIYIGYHLLIGQTLIEEVKVSEKQGDVCVVESADGQPKRIQACPYNIGDALIVTYHNGSTKVESHRPI